MNLEEKGDDTMSIVITPDVIEECLFLLD